MSRTPEGGSSSRPVEVEFENIHDSVSKMRKIAADIDTLEANFSSFAGRVSPTDWSTEPSCVAFGESYTAALAVYSNVISGMQADLVNIADALDAASKSYEQSDANASAALAKLGAVDDHGQQQDSQGRTAYEQTGHHEQLSSDKPTAAADTTPHDSAATTFPAGTPAGGSHGTESGTNAVQPGSSSPTTPPAGSGHKNSQK